MSRAIVQGRNPTEEHERVVDEYREALARKAEIQDWPYPPVTIGPTWQIDSNGYWLLPERSIGWQGLGWCGTTLQHGRGQPWRFTLEQARFWLWWYAIDEFGVFSYRDAVLQRLKGWGKDPFGACWLANEMLGPCRFVEFWHGTEAVATDHPDAWVQTAAVSLEQTKNTMRLFPGLFTPEGRSRYELQIGKEYVHGMRGRRFMQAVTSSPATLEGNRSTAVLCNEIHLWDTSNEGDEMWAVIQRNNAKAPDGGARTLSITNAYEPGRDSIGERRRTTYEKMVAGSNLTTGILYDSLEAAPEAPLTAEAAPLVVPSIRGDSVWLRPTNIVQQILDEDNPPSQSRRWWYNQITAAEEAWVTAQQWDSCRDESKELKPGDQIVEFFDGSKSDDNTALTACRISDGAVFCRRVWARPPDYPGWTVPRDQVDDLVRADWHTYDVVAFWADPSAGEDETGERYWDSYIDAWGRDFGGDGPDPQQLCIWPVESGYRRHAVLWDMREAAHVKMFTEACERTLADIESRSFVHDGHLVLRAHVLNARRRPNNYGVAIGKESRMSAKKIDAGVTAIGARMLWRMYQGLPENKKRQVDSYAGVSFL